MKRLVKIVGLGLSILLTVFALTCAAKESPENLSNRAPAGLPSPDSSASFPSSATSLNLPLRTLRDVPLSGGATRFDYQSFDQTSGRLYIAHLGDNSMAVFDVQKETLAGDVQNLAHVHGVLAVPEYCSAYLPQLRQSLGGHKQVMRFESVLITL